MKASYFDPATERVMEKDVSVADVPSLIATVLSLRSLRGHPALEVIHDDGSSLSLATDGEWAFLVYIDPLGDSFHSVGGSAMQGLVFDYLGSWSEASAGYLVPLDRGKRVMEAYVSQGKLDAEHVLFEPD